MTFKQMLNDMMSQSAAGPSAIIEHTVHHDAFAKDYPILFYDR